MVRTLMRHALTFASLSSLALALVLGALWWWSAARTRTFEYGWRGQRWEADVFRGRVVFGNRPQRVRDEDEARRAVGWWLDENESRLGPWRDKVDFWRGSAWRFPEGVAAEIAQVTAGTPGLTPPPAPPRIARKRGGEVSLALLTAIAAAPFAVHAPLALARWRRHRRSRRWRRTGRCSSCGYDLRGSGGRAPSAGRARGRRVRMQRTTKPVRRLRRAYPRPIPLSTRHSCNESPVPSRGAGEESRGRSRRALV
jgi:hypothetical protein